MSAWAYYNEIDEAAAHVIREQIRDGNIMDGEVDTRSIKDVDPIDLIGFRQCHFFAGGGIWSVAARLAGWPDDRPLWTGSCPCQPFSVAGKGRGASDPRHLWPDFFRLIRACRPPVVVGEQVAGAAGYGWFDGVSADLEGEGYASRAADIPACAVDAPHIRQRLYWVANSDRRGRITNGEREPLDEILGRSKIHAGLPVAERNAGDDMGHTESLGRREGRAGDAVWQRDGSAAAGASFWSDAELRLGADGKARRVKPGIRLLVDGLPGRVPLLRIAGNAIVAEAGAEVLAALREVIP